MGLSKAQEDLVRQYYHELPSLAAACVSLALYTLIAIVLTTVTAKNKAWFMMTVAFTALLEAAGFACRVTMLNNPIRLAYIMQQCFLIISPVLLAIVEYICVGRLIQKSDAKSGQGPSTLARHFARWFTASDILCLVIQSTAGTMLASMDVPKMQQGRKLMLAGLFLQLCFFTAFTVIAIHVHRSPKFGYTKDTRYHGLFLGLYSTITLMYIRNIFRVAEFVQGFDGYLARHERFFYVFDFVPIFLCCALFAYFHYGWYLNLPDDDESAAHDYKGTKTPAVVTELQVVVKP